MRCFGRRMRQRRWVAVAVVVAVTGVFLVSAAAGASDIIVQADSGAFSDDDGIAHEAALNALADRGFLDGTECAEGRICPSQPLKRWEMAVWLGRALSYGEPEPITESRFADVDAGVWWAPHVGRFADLGVTVGCATGPLRFCPDNSVTRAQMATFLKRALRLPQATSAGFTDTAGNTHESNIDVLAAEGITAGCATGPLRFCPDDSVTRAQMASFLSRALGLIPLPSGEPLSAQQVYAKVAPSIPIVQSAYGHGSGILIPGDYVVTNHHVVWPNDFDHTARVVFPDGTEYVDVPVVATNPWADVAVLGPLETEKRPLPLADGEQLPPGSDLYFVGYPGEFEHREGYAPDPTITSGLLSRVRHWDGLGLTLLQTDAAIAGGQSGGALVDSRGRVVGISTWGVIYGAFGLATSASDDARIVDRMLTETGFSASFHEGIDPDDDESRVWDIELAGAWDSDTFFVEEVAESIHLEVDGSGEGVLWMADAFGWLIGFHEDEMVASGSAEIDPHGLYFVEVTQVSAGAAQYRLTSSAALQPYYDEDGVVLLAADEPSQGLLGAFDYHGDIDFYELQLREGETVLIWTDSILADPALTLFDSASSIIAEDDNSGPLGALGLPINAVIEFHVPSTGTYYVQVYEAAGDARGGYIINAAILD